MQLRSDLGSVATKYQKLLSDRLILKALARTFDRGHQEIAEVSKDLTAKSHNLDPSLIDDAYTYKPARIGALSATATITGKGLSLRTFVVSGGYKGQPVGVHVKRPATLRSAFLVRSPSGKDIGVFTRDKARGKASTGKGTYAGRVVTRGPNAGRALEREPISKLFTVSTPGAVQANVPEAFEAVDLAAIFGEELESELAKLGLA